MNFRARLDRARAEMASRGIGTLLLSSGLDLPYFTGYTASGYERLTMLVLRADSTDAVLFVPELEAPLVDIRDELFELRPWSDGEDPVAMVAESITSPDPVAIGDETWSVFLLGLESLRPRARFVSATPITRELRMRKDAEELDLLRAAGASADRVAETIPDAGLAGRTECDVGTTIASLLVEEGHDEARFAIVASGPNAASPHHHAGERVIGRGDTVVIDFGGSYAGYQSDTTRTFHVGDPPPEVADAFAVLFEAQAAAVAAVKPGARCAEIDDVARQLISAAGHGEHFIHRTGHGIGLATHEEPYLVTGNEMPLEPQMCFSVEPGIYVRGRFGMRIEDIVAVTESGVETLNNSDRTLTVVD